ncbi:MAG: sigma-70 family RNA polymerase sigma factor [Planctomycetes bacterium]|nr:sigma-70 family RNA polymerase sigma factor [Planctomycetota bacterium]
MDDAANLTQMLQDVDEERDGAMDRLMEAVYGDLQRVAERHMAERYGRGLPGVTLEPAALVNESFMKLIRQRKSYGNRGQFFAIATKVMLRVLIDYERRRRATKRGGDRGRVTLLLEHGAAGPGKEDTCVDIEPLADVFERLEALDARKADVVKLRVVWGLQMPEIAAALDVSLATIERDWSFAKAWVLREAARAS